MAVDLSIVVFAYNEAENIGPVLAELRAWLQAHEPNAEILFVDDGSSDATAAEAARALDGMPHRVLRHERNRGIGAALKTGVAAASAPWVTFLPADGQIEPAAIGTLRAAAASDDSDVVFSVYADRDDGIDRKLMSFGVRALVLAVHGVKLRCEGPYLFRRELFIPEQLPSDSFFLNFEFPIRSWPRAPHPGRDDQLPAAAQRGVEVGARRSRGARRARAAGVPHAASARIGAIRPRRRRRAA